MQAKPLSKLALVASVAAVSFGFILVPTISQAAVDTTSISWWSSGKDSKFRYPTGDDQAWRFTSDCTIPTYSPSSRIATARFEFKRDNGLWDTSFGWKDIGCRSNSKAGSWGRMTSKVAHKYTFKGFREGSYLNDWTAISATSLRIRY